jgi:6-phosphogluconate dehydrogenase
MKLGMVGLGKMGGAMAVRLVRNGHSCVGMDRNPEVLKEFGKQGLISASSLGELIVKLDAPQTPKIVWLMLPSGEITESAVKELAGLLKEGDIVIDGGNSHYQDDARRSRTLAEKGIRYLDVGTSGGVWGGERGYCMMIGGDQATFSAIEPIFKALGPAAEKEGVQGYVYCGASGSGHFVKMIHNGIEYGMMQSFAEGFDLLKNSSYHLDLSSIAQVWTQGSVVSSWLLDLIVMALKKDPSLANYTGFVEDSGEGRWTILAALEEEVPVNVLAAALFSRFRSRKEHTFADKLLSAMRMGFGGHKEKAA